MAINEPTIKQAAMSLIETGQATVAEAAWLAGQSRQTMRYWVKGMAHVRALQGLPEARAKYLKAQWAKAIKATKSTGEGK